MPTKKIVREQVLYFLSPGWRITVLVSFHFVISVGRSETMLLHKWLLFIVSHRPRWTKVTSSTSVSYSLSIKQVYSINCIVKDQC